MSIKSRLAAAATALTLIVGVVAAGTLTADAATPRCGPGCTGLYSRAFGPPWVLNVFRQVGRAGQRTTLVRASRANEGQDFIMYRLGRVQDFFRAGLVAGGLNALYGHLSAYEIEYAPNGAFSGLCLGVPTAPGAGTLAVLEPCGVNARTVWIVDPVKTPSGTFSALISAATSRNFHHPYSLTVLLPRVPLRTESLATAAHSVALAHQLWRAWRGLLPGSAAR